MSKRDLIRLVILGFFIGLNIILGAYFLVTVVGTGRLPAGLSSVLELIADTTGIKIDQPQVESTSIPGFHEDIVADIEAAGVVNLVNQIRTEANLQEVGYSIALTAVATNLAEVLIDTDLASQSEAELDAQLENVLQQENYAYQRVIQAVVSGPTTMIDLEARWIKNKVVDLLTNAGVSQIGVSTQVVEKDGRMVGLTVVLLAEPLAQRAAQTPTTAKIDIPTALEISNQAVFTALNQYRADHGVHQLVENNLLCQYAEKRVQDLIAYGGLDNHQGFQTDFADLESLPDSIKQYSGGRIGENLAHQYCRNMTTNDSFVAQTGAALIEWCFDSSTKGHREAQLDSTFNNVCVRHGENMYVVIFGE